MNESLPNIPVSQDRYPYVTRSLLRLYQNGDLQNVTDIDIEPDYGYVSRITYIDGSHRVTYRHYILNKVMHFAIVMIMNQTTLTITSKGQTTIPASIRRKLGLNKAGGVLQISFNESKGELIVSKPLSIDELTEKLSAYAKPDTKPLTDVDAFYQANRQR